MKNEIFEAINSIDDELIAEAAEIRKPSYRRISTWAAAAAVFVLLAVGVTALNRQKTDIQPPEAAKTTSNEKTDAATDGKAITTSKGTASADSLPEQTTLNDICHRIVPTLDFYKNLPDIVWGTDGTKGPEQNGKVTLGTVKITDSLKKLTDGKPRDTIYAVMVDFSSCINEDEMSNWKYGGTTLKKLEEERRELMKNGKIVGYDSAYDSEHGEYTYAKYEYPDEARIAEINGKIDEIKKAYYNECLKKFETTFKNNELVIYTDNSAVCYENHYFYVFANKEQLESFKCKSDEAFVFMPAVKYK